MQMRIEEKFSLRVREGINSDTRIPIPKLAAVQFDAAIEENPIVARTLDVCGRRATFA